MTNPNDITEVVLAATTAIVVKYGDTEWQTRTLMELAELEAKPFKVYAWTNDSVRIAEATISLIPHTEGYNVHQVLVGGLRFRCAAKTKWPVLRRIEGIVHVDSDALKSGDRVLIHDRFGKDSIMNLAGYQRVETFNIAQVKTANGNVALIAVHVKGGGSILLSNGVFAG